MTQAIGDPEDSAMILGSNNWAAVELRSPPASVINNAKELFGLYELRVAFCMNEDDAGSLVSGGIGKFKGIEKPNRAVFVKRMTNENTWLRPYVQEGPQ